jgi:hypothetical protein
MVLLSLFSERGDNSLGLRRGRPSERKKLVTKAKIVAKRKIPMNSIIDRFNITGKSAAQKKTSCLRKEAFGAKKYY